MSDISWQKIYSDLKIDIHDFDKSPFQINADDIKKSCQDFKKTAEKEVRILCKQDTRSQRPRVFRDNGLFLLPIKNGTYNLIKGEGYFDIPEITSSPVDYKTKLSFEPVTSSIGNSEMQHVDYAFATGLIKEFVGDNTIVLTIRGRKYCPNFSFIVNKHEIIVKSVQTEVDAGYEGREKVVLVEVKNSATTDTIIRQLFYPYRQWAHHSKKEVITLFFEKRGHQYHIWKFEFQNPQDYNSIKLAEAQRFVISK